MALLLKIIALSFLLFSSFNISAQFKINGTVKDSLTNEPLAFTTVVVNDSQKVGTSTDINGRFFISLDNEIQFLSISHIGYKSKKIVLKNFENTQNLIILLEPSFEFLPETFISVENPAIQIIKKVIDKKDFNNPKKMQSFIYNSYSKTIIDSKNKDSLNSSLFKGENYLFLTELLTKRKFLASDLDNEEILATRMSGLKHSAYYFLATQGQPFSFYEEPIKLLNQNYLNPISNSAIRSYDYKLEEKYLHNNDTIYIISFKPKSQKHFNSLKGILYINSDNYAIQNVIAEPYDTGKVHLKIQHQYKKIENQWFPEQLNYQATFFPILNKRIDSLNTEITIDSKTFIDSVKINPILKRSDFKIETLFLNTKTNQQASTLISAKRKEPLTKKETKTYQVIDSISEELNFERKLQYFEKLPIGKVSFNSVDIELNHLININKFEGVRLGTGLSTNRFFNENFSIGGNFGYGLKDRRSKYGAHFTYFLNPKNELNFIASWNKTLVETGSYISFTNSDYNFFDFNPRSFMSSQFDKNQSINASISAVSFRYLKWKIAVNHASISPLYGTLTDEFNTYVFQYQNLNFSGYNAFQFQFYMRFAYKEKIMKMFDYNLSMGTDYPVFTIAYESAIKDVFNSDISYNKIKLDFEHQIKFNKLGDIYYNLAAGFIDRPIPYGLLFGGHGSFDKKIPFIANNHFQTMLPYEFVSDKFVNLFLTYRITRFFPKNNIFSPDISLAHNMGIGGLSRKETHQNINFKTLENPYLESGLLLSNLIKFDLYNVSSLGIGGAVFYRYGPHSFEKQQDNYVFKIDFAISLN